MSTLKSIQQAIAPELQQLNTLILQQLNSNFPLMDTVVNTYLRTKGKQIRPIIVILTAQLLGEINQKVLSAAAAVELLHNASLIHDDVVDNSPIRRGTPTINAIWDNHIAVLVGDYFVSSAMQQAIATADIRVIDSLCYLGKLLSLGELDQIYNARYHKHTEEAYFRIINYKTASLFVACAKMGAYAVDASESDLENVTKFAELLGLCFQMRDDVLDYSTESAIGKPAGNDLREGKITLPLLHALECSTDPQRDEMLTLAKKESLTDDEIAVLMDFAEQNGGIEYTYSCMKSLRDEAVAILEEKYPGSEAAQRLIAIFDSIISR